jgi:hypothetical protein
MNGAIVKIHDHLWHDLPAGDRYKGGAGSDVDGEIIREITAPGAESFNQDETTRIDAGRSILANLKALPADLASGFYDVDDPSNNILAEMKDEWTTSWNSTRRSLRDAKSDGELSVREMGVVAGKAGLAVLYNATAQPLRVAYGVAKSSAMVVKDVADAAVYGVFAGIRAIGSLFQPVTDQILDASVPVDKD